MTRYLGVALAVVLTGQAFGQLDVPAYLTTTAPVLDGVISPGEWDAAGPATFVSGEAPDAALDANPIPEDPYGGNADLSFSYRVMWEEPWTVYFAFEITDDIAMEEDPTNLWERDQLELFFDGDNLEGSDDLVSFQWWDNAEPFGKFGVSRNNTYEGNGGQLTDDVGNLFADDEFSYLVAAAMAAETGENGNWVVEYAINLEPMQLLGTFADDTVTEEANQLVADHTQVKFQVAVSDDDNFVGDGTERSHTLAILGLSDWRASNEFPNLVFKGAFTGGTPGDFNGDGNLDGVDIDALSAAVGGADTAFDLNGDGSVSEQDRLRWIHDLKQTWVGDSNFDGVFDSSDFVAVFTLGEYEDATAGNSGWVEGDWNGDGDFNSSDFVAAFTDGGYDQGPRAAVAAVPEPASVTLLTFALAALPLARHRRS